MSEYHCKANICYNGINVFQIAEIYRTTSHPWPIDPRSNDAMCLFIASRLLPERYGPVDSGSERRCKGSPIFSKTIRN